MSILGDLNKLKNKTKTPTLGRGVIVDINTLKTRQPVQSEFSPKEQEVADLIDGIVPEKQRRGFLNKLFERGKYQAPQFREKAKPMKFRVGEGLGDEETIVRPGPTKQLEKISKLPGFKPEDIKFELEVPERIAPKLVAEERVRFKPDIPAGPKPKVVGKPSQELKDVTQLVGEAKEKADVAIRGIGSFVLDIVIGFPAKAIIATNLAVSKKQLAALANVRPEDVKYTPTGKIEKLFLGEEPIEPLSSKSKRGYERGLALEKKVPVPPGLEGILGAFGGALPLLFGLIDMVPVISPKNAGKAIAKEAPKIAALKESKEILKILKTFFKGADDVLPEIAEGLAKIDNPKEVERVMTDLVKLTSQPNKDRAMVDKIFKALEDVKKPAAKVAAEPTVIPKELEPLAQEAKKYKSAEEFLEGIFSTFFRKRTEQLDALAGGDYAKYLKVGGGFKGNAPKAVIEFDTQTAIMARKIQELRESPQRLTDFYNQAVKGIDDVAGRVGVTTSEPRGAIVKSLKEQKESRDILKTVPLKKDISEKIKKGETAIQKLIKAIDVAVPARKEQEKLYSAERSRRVAKVVAAGKKLEGEEALFAQLGALKGELPRVKQFEAIRGSFGTEEVTALFNMVEGIKTILPLEKVTAKVALKNLLEGVIPTEGEIKLLREVFPKELIDAVLSKRSGKEKFLEFLSEIINVPRTMMASVDLSAPFRQGIFMVGRPLKFTGAMKEMFKVVGSDKAYLGLMDNIAARPSYLKMRKGGLALTDIGGPLSTREEAFIGNMAEKIPLYGSLIRASNRAYTGFLNKLRVDVFDDLLRKSEVLGIEHTDEFLKSLADFINAGTGRGKFGLAQTGVLPKQLERAATVMNGLFFSPRLMASRLNLLNPYFYSQLDPFVRKEALKTLFATTGIAATTLGILKMNGAEVELDPRNADFLKAKFGNTRYDILGGFQQYARVAAQLITGEIVSSTTGRTITLGEGYRPLTRKEIAQRFFEYKTSPIASFAIGLFAGETAIGQDFDIPTEIINRFIPMVIQDLYDISVEDGAEGLLYGLPAVFGVGVQTYGKQELVTGESLIGEPTMQIQPIPELAEKIRELVFGQIPLPTSRRYNIEAYVDQLYQLPSNEAADIWDLINKNNPELAEKINDVIDEKGAGITVHDKDLKAKGVASGDRARAVVKDLNKLKTNKEKADLWDEYIRKRILTKEVQRQVNLILDR